MSTNSPAVQVKEKIDLTEKEKMIFDRPLATIRHFDPSTELRVVGGWVHDKDGVFGGTVDQLGSVSAFLLIPRSQEFLAISGDSANPYLITTTMTFRNGEKLLRSWNAEESRNRPS
ncbi:hypothetical protein NL676_028068 [Syzygium grande]|nr:hypothetical protein NL676_028068 [Syzygium grande]